jgi:hypothetical protein
VTKQVSVKNTGLTDGSYSEVYVRIQLKEYFEIIPMKIESDGYRYMVDNTGKFIIYPTEADALAAYEGHTVTELTDAVSGEHGWFVRTQGGDNDGQYGREVYTTYELDYSEIQHLVGTTREDADADALHNTKPNGECTYPIHFWDDISNLNNVYAQPNAENYVKWNLGGVVNGNPTVMLMTDWISAGSQPVAAWIIDDRDKTDFATGEGPWIYWGQLLQPGEETADFLKTIELLQQPDGEFYYAIHVEMEAVSLDEMLRTDVDGEGNPKTQWTDMPTEIKDSYVANSPKVTLDFDTRTEPYSIYVGDTFTAPDVTVKPAGSATNVTWTSDNDLVATVDETTGLVTGVSPGEVTITVTAANGEKASYTITILPDDVTEFKVDWFTNTSSGNHDTSYRGVKTVTDPTLSNVSGNNFDHGSTTAPTQSRTWRATVTGNGTTHNNSKWEILSQTGSNIVPGLTWHNPIGSTTNYLDIPADYNGTIKVRVSAQYNSEWDVEFEIAVEPRPIVANGRQLLPAKSGDTVNWTEVATYTDSDGKNYSLIVRNNRISLTAFGTDGHYDGSTLQSTINNWWNTTTATGLIDYAVTNNAMYRLGTTFVNVGDGFSKPLGPELAGRTANTAFPLSSGEGIQFCSYGWGIQDGVNVSNSGDSHSNCEKLSDLGYGGWLRSMAHATGNASRFNSTGVIISDAATVSSATRPALWVKTEIFD